MPYDLVEQFASTSHLTGQTSTRSGTKLPGIVSAIDGSNAIIAESGSFALATIRAAQTTFDKGERSSRAITPLSVISVGPERRAKTSKFS